MESVNPQEQLGKLHNLVGKRVVLLPLELGSKGPKETGWQKTTFEQTQKPSYQKRLLAALHRGGNIGVVLGTASGNLCTIDIDTDTEIEPFLALNPKLANSLCTRGANGCQIWVRIVGKYPARRVNSKLKVPGNDNKKSVAEWRGGGGHQSVIQGKHPDDGIFYRFMVEKLAIEIAFDEIKWPESWGMSFDGGGAKQRQSAGGAGAKQRQPERATAGKLPPERIDRILRYIEKVDPAVSGKGGSNPTFRLANTLVWDFGLTTEQAHPFMTMYSMKKCEPPWSETEISHKLEDAQNADQTGEPPRGHLWGEDDFRDVPWPDPQPLRGRMRPVTKLRAEMIPEPLRAWLADIANRMQCPLDFVGSAALVMVSGVIGAGCTIRPKQRDDWAVVCNLWGGIIARPGMLKSPSIDEAFKPLRRLEVEAKKRHDVEMDRHEAAQVAFESKRKAIKAQMDACAKKGEDMSELEEHYAGLKPLVPPKRTRFLTNDATIEKAHELMSQNPRGITINRDELVGLLLTWDRDDRKDDRYFHLQAWNGYGSYTTDRIGRGTIDTPQLCESVFGGMQPSKLLGYLAMVRSDIGNDGLLQRFQLLVYPDEPFGEPKIVDEWPNPKAKERVFTIVSNLAEMDFQAYGAESEEFSKIPYFHFAPDAQEFFNKWFLELEGKLQSTSEDPIIIEHLAKYRKLMPSLALIFHLIDAADQTVVVVESCILTEPQKEVSLRNAQLAAEWCAYLETHARRIYGLATNVAVQSARRLLEKIKDDTLQDGFNPRDIYSQNWAFLDSKELTKAAIDELIETGWLREIPLPKPAKQTGRPLSPTYRIHPKAREILRKGGHEVV